MEKKVITLVGMPGAGKSYCVEYLENVGLPSVYFGGITLDEIRARGLDINPENEKMVREDIRAKEGKAAYAARIIKKINEIFKSGSSYVVADGLYSWTEYKEFKQAFGDNAIIIAITAPRNVRHQRLENRPVRPLTSTEVSAREYAEIENIEKGGPIANADYTIVNDSAPEDMLAKLRQILSSEGIGLNKAD